MDNLSFENGIMKSTTQATIAVVYPFFAHYRAPVMKALIAAKDFKYILAGDTQDPDSSIKAWIPPAERFLHAPCSKVAGALVWQRGVLPLALRHDIAVLVILGNPNIISNWIIAALGRLRGKRVLFWTHGWLRDETGFKALLRIAFYRLGNGLLLYGARARSIGKAKGFDERYLYVVFNSLDYDNQIVARSRVSPETIARVRTQLFGNSKTPVLICTSRLTIFRGLDLLLKAMVVLREGGFEHHLILVGEGPEEPRLTQMAKNYRLSVHFYGSCYDEDRLAELLMASDLTVVPGKVGLTAIHSLVYGTPVITEDAPADQGPEIEAIIPNETGDFFRPGDANELASVIHKWTHGSIDRMAVRAKCHAVVEQHYTPRYQAQAIANAIAGEPAAPDTLSDTKRNSLGSALNAETA